MPTGDLAARLQQIHEQLIAGSRVASRDLFVAALGPLKAFVLSQQRALDEDEAHDVATDVLIAHIHDFGRYDASQASLWTYLCMCAKRDGLDRLRKRARQQGLLEESSTDVELWGAGANNPSASEEALDAQRIIRMHGERLVTNEPERRVLALILDGERSTAAFAQALGLDAAHPQTADLVKQAKDRLLLRLRRLRDEL